MPTQVEIPDQGVVEFPDGMSPDDIKGVIQNKFYGANAPSLPNQVVTPQEPSATQKVIGAINQGMDVVQQAQSSVLNPASMVTDRMVPESVNRFMKQGLVSPETMRPIVNASMLPVMGLSEMLFGKEAVQEPLDTTGKAISEFASSQTSPENIAVTLGTAGVGAVESALSKRLPNLGEILFGTKPESRRAPEPPPTVSLGAGTIADDVSRALDRRFTIVEPPPEPPPELSPAPPIEQTLQRMGQPLPFNPEAGPAPVPEFQMPLRTEQARIGGEPNAIEQSNAQVQGGEAPLGVQARTESTVPRSSDSNNVIGETQGAETGGTIPQEITPAVPPEQPPEPISPYAPKETAPVPEAEAATTAQPLPKTESPMVSEVNEGLTAGDSPQVSAIANRFTKERSAQGELGEIAPGQGVSTVEMAQRGLRMSPEEINQHVSDLVNDTGDIVKQGQAVRAEEARLSQRSGELSKIADANPNDVNAKVAADDAFKDLTDFHNGPVAALKSKWHATGVQMQGEIPVDLSTFNGLREAWLRDTGEAPPKSAEPTIRKTAEKVSDSITGERDAMTKLGQEIDKKTSNRKLPTYDEVRNNIRERIGLQPCPA